MVITGASTGIGEACALHLDKLGYRVFAGIRKAADGESLRRRASERLVPVRLDISDETEVGQAARNVIEALGGEGLAGLVNNAGIVVGGMLEFLPLDALRRQLEVNVVGQIAVTQAFLPSLRKARGRIVNIGSRERPDLQPVYRRLFRFQVRAGSFDGRVAHGASALEDPRFDCGAGIYSDAHRRRNRWPPREALRAQLPPEALQLYGAALHAVCDATEREAAKAAPTEVVVKAVVHALTARRPRTRYVVGANSGFQISLGRALPDRWRDALIARHLGLK